MATTDCLLEASCAVPSLLGRCTAMPCRQVWGRLHPVTVLHRNTSLQPLGIFLYNSVAWVLSVEHITRGIQLASPESLATVRRIVS